MTTESTGVLTAVSTDAAPAPAGTYSQAVATDHLVFISGQTPRLACGTRLLDRPFEEQTRQTMDNLAAVARAAGTDLRHAVSVTVFLRDPAQAAAFDCIYRQYVGHPPPARTLVQSDLTIGELEVNAVVARPVEDTDTRDGATC